MKATKCIHTRAYPLLSGRPLRAKTRRLPSFPEPFPLSGLELPRPISVTASGSERAVLPCFGLAACSATFSAETINLSQWLCKRKACAPFTNLMTRTPYPSEHSEVSRGRV